MRDAPSRRLAGLRGCATSRSISPVAKLAFLGRARALGFSIEDCQALLALYEDQDRTSADVKALAEEHLVRVDDKIAQLQSMQATLRHLVQECAGDNRPDGPILRDLAKG